MGTKPDSAPTQISGYQASNGHIYIAADAFDRSLGITMYEVDNPADITNRDSWKPWTGDDFGQAGPDSAARARSH
ncbi:hypothetical protein [Mycobacterium kiyosense]|nr:hypothetical protein IWGMT90018_17120 [Mycobacterium kiyosense]